MILQQPSRIIGTIEARMGSSRLPGKTMMPLPDGLPLLHHVVQRFRQCKSLDDVLVATTVEAGDDPIANWCGENRVTVFRGSENDVLDRVTNAALANGADAIVQMGADSAYLDFELIDQLVAHYRSGQFDYVCNDLKLTYPLGIYGHVVRVNKLAAINARSDVSEKDRSDVVRYIWEHAGEYAISCIEAPAALRCPELRLTIDYPEDMAQAHEVYRHFEGAMFVTPDIIDLYRSQPEMFAATGKLVQQSAPFIASSPDAA
jgi:spore coat polysaccharide biosynthesis protein SpsF